jgi:hypothetical protein
MLSWIELVDAPQTRSNRHNFRVPYDYTVLSETESMSRSHGIEPLGGRYSSTSGYLPDR